MKPFPQDPAILGPPGGEPKRPTTPDPSLALVVDLRASLASALDCLLRPAPETLDECRRRFERSAERLRQLSRSRSAVPAGAGVSAANPRSTVVRLARDLQECQRLAEQAGAFYWAWSKILLSATGTYDAAGELRGTHSGNLLGEG